ncbi:MAG TPA: oligosaccharide flippase family protein, partial [Anaeromyxobacteraceae bacterium]|nr:oligosaccharide flippase family protein [Anaeromyxobacteraceae bacterium]
QQMINRLRSFVHRKRELLLPSGSLRGRFALGLFWSLFAAVISRSFNLAASVVAARLLGEARFGEYGMVQSTVGTAGAFSVLGLGLTAIKYVAEYRDKDPARVARVLRMSSIASIVSGLLVAAVLALVSPLLASRVLAAPRLSVPLMLGSTMVLLNAVLSFQNGALAGFEAFRALARTSVASGLASFPLIALGAWKGGVAGTVIGTSASVFVNVLLNEWILRGQCRKERLPRGDGWRQELPVFWSFSLPAFLASFAVAPSLWMCNALLVNHPGGYPQLGLYTAADRWRIALLFVPTTVFRMVLPMLSNLKGNANMVGYDRVNRANLLLNLAVVAVPALAICGLAGSIMAAYGPGFRVGWPILAVLAIGTIPEALNTVFGYPLIVAHRMWMRFGFDVVLALVILGLGAALIPSRGAFGLAVAYVTGFTVTSTGLYLFTWRPLDEAAKRHLDPAPG